MSKAGEIIERKLARLETVPDNFISTIEKYQRPLYEELLEILKTLKVDKNGFIPASELSKVESIANRLKQTMFNSQYGEAVKEFLSEFPPQAQLNIDYFRTFGDLSTESLQKEVLAASISAAADVLNGSTIDKVLINPLKNFLTQNISSGANYFDVVKGLRTIIEGTPEADGLLLRHVKLIARDSFATAERTYTEAISKEMGLVFFLYSGGVLRDSRDFCLQRQGRYFHRKEIESWASKDWQGKNPNTTPGNIFSLVGGYNCIHSLVPFPTDQVPKSEVARAKRLGYY